MSNTNKLVILIALILIVVCLVAQNKNNSEQNIISSEEQIREVSYNEVTNEVTGEKEYVVYDKDTGEEITRVEEEYQLEIYKVDPNYEELPVFDNQDDIGEIVE